jgi:hypothetical protein
VVSYDNSSIYDSSDANFNIVPSTASTITVTSPNGGESWLAGSVHPITWTSTNLTGNVSIQLSRDGGSTWTTIVSNSANDGSESWIVTSPATAQARIRVVSYSNASTYDASDANFNIVG